jgi:hypothetical protein
MTDTRGIGDNSGQPAEIVRDQLAAMLAMPHGIGQSFEQRKAELIASAGRCAVTDNDSVGRAGDLQAMIVRLLDAVDQRVTEIAEPHALAVGAVRAGRERFAADLLTAQASVRALVDAFRDDQRKKAKEAADQQRADEAARRQALKLAEPADPASAPAVALPAVKGDFGSRTGDRKVKTYSWKDPRKVDLLVLNHAAVQEAMQRACRDLNKVQATIKGVTITEGAATTVRTRT